MPRFSTVGSDSKVSNLVVSQLPEDLSALRMIFGGSPWDWEGVATREEACSWLAQRGRGPIVICDRDLPDGGWRQLLQETESLARPPKFIVSSRFADEELWMEVLGAGGHDVLRTPFDASEAYRVVRFASEAWHLRSGRVARRPRSGNWLTKALGSASAILSAC
ncbi:MAG: response regulator [Acidobacteriota bacterium]|nr:response regulator [Acidobacteriota bacterium]